MTSSKPPRVLEMRPWPPVGDSAQEGETDKLDYSSTKSLVSCGSCCAVLKG